MAERNFANMYAVTLSGGNYDVGGLVKTDVGVVDIRDAPRSHDSPRVLGDVPNDHFELIHAGPNLNGLYEFVSVANEGNSFGFIATDGTNLYFITDDTTTPGKLHVDPGLSEVLCFMPGTRILTPTGEIPVEELSPGDSVLTVDGRAVPVRWIGRQAVASMFADELLAPVRIRAGALADNVPSRDLLTSPDHALFMDGILVHAGALVNGSSIVRERDLPERFTYYHVEVADHSLILAESTPAETFIDNVDRQRFDNWDEYRELNAESATMTELPYPRAKAYRQVPRATRDRLEQRGLALYGQASVKAA